MHPRSIRVPGSFYGVFGLNRLTDGCRAGSFPSSVTLIAPAGCDERVAVIGAALQGRRRHGLSDRLPASQQKRNSH